MALYMPLSMVFQFYHAVLMWSRKGDGNKSDIYHEWVTTDMWRKCWHGHHKGKGSQEDKKALLEET